MATQPKPHEPDPKPAPKPDPDPDPPAAKAEGHMVEHPSMKGIADEQRERSEEMQREGIDAWKAAHDERDPDEKPKVVPGVQHRPVEEHEARTGRR